MEHIKHYFNQFVDISDEELLLFTSKLTRMDVPKKSLILKQGKTENFLSFIEKGIVRFYIPDLDDGLTFSFSFEHSFFSAYDSFLTQRPCTYNVEAVTDCILWRLAYDDLNSIYSTTAIGERIGRKVAEDLYLKKMKREISLLNDPAKKRYLDLMEEAPLLLQHIPLKHLATYIGIRPQSLSRIRKQIY
ncbi:MAG TPA: Crp/Fnr family transcriptional regulator [Sphingobacterium sp.]|jgi:CRP-like cAMP-binding protein|nr:Crp/Fnr family transcriptional regulator [Sphingobacterium sp.]